MNKSDIYLLANVPFLGKGDNISSKKGDPL